MQLVVDKIARSFGINEIFKDISFMIDKGEKIGLVGVNGSGKTTLLRCLLAPETVDGGVVRFEPGLKIGYVEQGFQNIGTGSLWQFMLRSCPAGTGCGAGRGFRGIRPCDQTLRTCRRI